MIYKKLLFILVLFSFSLSAIFSVINVDGYSVQVDSQKDKVLNTNIDSTFSFTIKNTKYSTQSFNLNITPSDGWDIILSEDSFNLAKGEEKTVNIRFIANSNFDYTPDVISSDVIKISQRDDYSGHFEFPIIIIGSSENVSLKYQIDIEKEPKKSLNFITKFSTEDLSPESNLKYTIKAENIEKEVQVDINVMLGNIMISEYTDTFSKDNFYKIKSEQISSKISPGKYLSKITVRLLDSKKKSAKEWFEKSELVVKKYEKIIIDETSESSFYKYKHTYNLKNIGNIQSNFTSKLELNLLESLLFSSNTITPFEENGVNKFKVTLNQGESKTISYSVNYIPLYIIIIISLIVAGYIYVRRNSNPLVVEASLYEIKKTSHEGVKSLKVRLGFENIKANSIDEIKLIFRMPSYLTVKDNSFLLSEPNHVLKGRNQFKLEWVFKKFELNDSRILGFTLENKKGILGDIRLEDLEIEIKEDAKVRKYYKNLPIIKG